MKQFFLFFSLFVWLSACSNNQSGSARQESSPPAETNAPAQPQPAAPAASSTSQQDEPMMAGNIRNALRNDLLKDDLNVMTEDQRRFTYAEYDLNDDGKMEYFVGFPKNSYFCGSGGCTFYLLSHTEGQVITRFTVTDPPFIVLKSKTNGWRDLVVYSDGALRKLTYNGTKYPSNPSVAPKYNETPGDGLPRLLDFDLPLPVYSF